MRLREKTLPGVFLHFENTDEQRNYLFECFSAFRRGRASGSERRDLWTAFVLNKRGVNGFYQNFLCKMFSEGLH